ncbi:hypothetical protein WOSG25_081370, partial [Weissella oryzae SG25]
MLGPLIFVLYFQLAQPLSDYNLLLDFNSNKKDTLTGVFILHRDVLSSQEAILQLLLALLSLTSVFGMGTGV